MAETWTRNDFRGDSVLFEPYTNLRFLFFALAGIGVIGVLVCAIGLIAEQRWQFAAAIPFCVLLTWLSLKTQARLKETYRVESSGVYFDRALLGWHSTRQIADLGSVYRVVVDSKPHFMSNAQRRGRTPPDRWSYGLALVLHRGKVIRLTESDADGFELVVNTAGRFADRFGLTVEPPDPSKYLRVKGRNPPSIEYEAWQPYSP